MDASLDSILWACDHMCHDQMCRGGIKSTVRLYPFEVSSLHVACLCVLHSKTPLYNIQLLNTADTQL